MLKLHLAILVQQKQITLEQAKLIEKQNYSNPLDVIWLCRSCYFMV